MDDLCEKIKESEVKVEMESHSSNLADELNKIRHQYDGLATKNLRDTEDWYQNKVPQRRSGLRLLLLLLRPLHHLLFGSTV